MSAARRLGADEDKARFEKKLGKIAKLKPRYVVGHETRYISDSCRGLRGGDGSRHSRSRFGVLQKPILGTVDSEYWNCPGVRSFLLEIPEASMNEARVQVYFKTEAAQRKS